ncbi:MAG: tetratricopeptide repeat protein [Candidatus Thermoplasmatota archaeon]|nr:tetratricopeptide repeat protein [Candidatus Thermoplasmatota archaeon]
MAMGDANEELRRAEEAFGEYRYEEALNSYKKALTFLDRETDSFRKDKMRAQALIGIVDSLDVSGKWFDALMYVDTITNIARTRKDLHLEIEANLRAAKLLVRRGSWKQAKGRLDTMRNTIESHGSFVERGEMYYGLGTVEWRLGKHEEAKILAQKAIKFAKEGDDKVLEGRCLILLASIYHDLGEFKTAISHFNNSIDLLSGTEELRELARAHNNVGEVYKVLEDYGKASSHYRTCVEIASASGNKRSEAYGLVNGAECMAKEGMLAEASNMVERAQKVLKEMDEQYAMANLYFVRGLIGSKSGNQEDMDLWFKKAISKMEELETPYDTGVFAYEYARALEGFGRHEEARAMCQKAVQAFSGIGSSVLLERTKSCLERLDGKGE